MIIVNCKAFVSGTDVLRLAKLCKKYKAVIAVQHADLALAASTGAAVIAQHVDSIEKSAKTGFILPESIQSYAVGSLINHSERPLSLKEIGFIIKKFKQLNLISIVCASTPSMVAKIAKFEPDIIAIEPPELIGGKISVSTAKPQIISASVKAAKGIPVLCGAGVHTANDVKIAKKLGAVGVLVASGVVKAKSPESVLRVLSRF